MWWNCKMILLQWLWKRETYGRNNGGLKTCLVEGRSLKHPEISTIMTCRVQGMKNSVRWIEQTIERSSEILMDTLTFISCFLISRWLIFTFVHILLSMFGILKREMLRNISLYVVQGQERWSHPEADYQQFVFFYKKHAHRGRYNAGYGVVQCGK